MWLVTVPRLQRFEEEKKLWADMIHSEISKEAAGGGRDRLRRDRDRDLLTTYNISWVFTGNG